MAQELDIARTVQMSLLPKQNPLVEGYDIAGVCIPALEVGGDYYDFFHLGDNKIGIAIGDVSGKGVPAAIYMTLTKGILQTCASDSTSPKQVLNKLNKQIYNNIERSSFVSMFYAVLNMKTNTIRFARAGHNPAILVHRSTKSNTLLEPKGMAVGLEPGDKFDHFLEEHEIQLEKGDVLTFYTDGFTEASTKNGDEFGEDGSDQIAGNAYHRVNVAWPKSGPKVERVHAHQNHDNGIKDSHCNRGLYRYLTGMKAQDVLNTQNDKNSHHDDWNNHGTDNPLILQLRYRLFGESLRSIKPCHYPVDLVSS